MPVFKIVGWIILFHPKSHKRNQTSFSDLVNLRATGSTLYGSEKTNPSPIEGIEPSPQIRILKFACNRYTIWEKNS